MVGLTFRLDEKAAKKSHGGQSFIGWQRIHVLERTLCIVEHRTVDQEREKKHTPHMNPPDTVDAYEYTLHCLVTDTSGGFMYGEEGTQEYQSIAEEELHNEILEGIYKFDANLRWGN
jgi:hypothetical protein